MASKQKNRFTTPHLGIKVLVVAVFAVFGLVMLNQTKAATGLYVSGPTKVQKNAEFTMAVKLTTGDPVDAVDTTLTYDPDKLQFVSVDDSTSAFPIKLQHVNDVGSVQLVRGKLDGMVTGDLLVANVTFKALANTNRTTLGLSGNATSAGSYTNPLTTNFNLSITNPKRK